MTNPNTFSGIDVGTTTTKAVIINADKQILGQFVRRSGADLTVAATEAFEEAVAQAGNALDMDAAQVRDTVQAIVATGYGRKSVPFAYDAKTEISCHGRGCHHYYPEKITIVDIGGQDSKIIKLNAQGKQVGFKMNRKCAAGTGAFLEEIAYKLDMPIGELSQLAQASSETTKLGSYCTVFTATEVLDRIRAGESIGAISRGLFESVAKRILEMDTLTGRVVMTGGVVQFHSLVADLLGSLAKTAVEIAPHPQVMGAFGAALFAAASVDGNE